MVQIGVVDNWWIYLVCLIFIAYCQIFMIQIQMMLLCGLFLLLQLVILIFYFNKMDVGQLDKWSPALKAIFFIVLSILLIHCLLFFALYLYLDSLLPSKPILSNLLLSFEPFLPVSLSFPLFPTRLLTLTAEQTAEN